MHRVLSLQMQYLSPPFITPKNSVYRTILAYIWISLNAQNTGINALLRISCNNIYYIS